MNTPLKLLIIKSPLRQYEITAMLGWHPSKLSNLINETYVPSELEMLDVCKILKCDINEAFPGWKSRRKEKTSNERDAEILREAGLTFKKTKSGFSTFEFEETVKKTRNNRT